MLVDFFYKIGWRGGPCPRPETAPAEAGAPGAGAGPAWPLSWVAPPRDEGDSPRRIRESAQGELETKRTGRAPGSAPPSFCGDGGTGREGGRGATGGGGEGGGAAPAVARPWGAGGGPRRCRRGGGACTHRPPLLPVGEAGARDGHGSMTARDGRVKGARGCGRERAGQPRSSEAA